MKINILLLGISLLVITSCVSSINRNELNINITNIEQSKILPLKNCNNDITLSQIGSSILDKSGFLDTEAPAYGYYAVVLENKNDAAPNFFILGLVNGITVFIPSLIGFPTDLQKFDVSGYLYIFDSAGNLIKTYRKTETFNKLAGLYYGQDPNKKASKYYSSLFKSVLEQADFQKDEINYLLEASGPVTNENMQEARTKIDETLRKFYSRY